MPDKNVSVPGRLDFSNIKTYPVKERTNLVTIENMARPGIDEVPEWGGPDFDELVERIVIARKAGRPVIWSMGAHVIKNGLSRYLIELVHRGFITHISSNGAGSIHDFELAFNGGTSEDVSTAIEDGSFGMWEETGRWMNEALFEGAEKDWVMVRALRCTWIKTRINFPIKMNAYFTGHMKAMFPQLTILQLEQILSTSIPLLILRLLDTAAVLISIKCAIPYPNWMGVFF